MGSELKFQEVHDRAQLVEGERLIDAWDARVPDIREFIRCRLIHRLSTGTYEGQYWDDESDEWIEDGDLNQIWAWRIANHRPPRSDNTRQADTTLERVKASLVEKFKLRAQEITIPATGATVAVVPLSTCEKIIAEILEGQSKETG